MRHVLTRLNDRPYNPENPVYEVTDDVERGQYCLVTGPDGAYHWACLWVPGTPAPQHIPLRPHKKYRNGASWELVQAAPLTLHPSINWVDVWHGWVQNGEAYEA